jgi:hypothetical protein
MTLPHKSHVPRWCNTGGVLLDLPLAASIG